MAEKSLYNLILENIKDGNLPVDFTLPREEETGEYAFADGAWDGICRYHMGNSGLDAAGTKRMAKALKAAAEEKFEEADRLFSELGEEYLPIDIVDEFQSYIVKNEKKLPAEHIYNTALHLILHSRNKEAVKFGMEMLELFSNLSPQTKTVIRNIGLCDEFTIFAVWVMQKWKYGNEEVFDLAKKVRGWGKIHAVEALSPDTPEISDWLLLNGIYNGIMYEYSALTVWEKANVAQRLSQNLTDEEFKAVTDIIDALLNEGPVPGISEVENAQTHILNFLTQAEKRNLSENEYNLLLTIGNWAENENLETVKNRTAGLLRSAQRRDAITAAAIGSEIYEEESEDE